MRHFLCSMVEAGCTCRSFTNGTLTNNTFNGNSAYQSGGAVYDQDVSSNITDNTFSNNTAKTSAKSIYRQVPLVARDIAAACLQSTLRSSGGWRLSVPMLQEPVCWQPGRQHWHHL